ncbi:hypothetical protein NXW44_24785 [Phocaeicola vulgatus]|uniref:hypothetical protein n=1 Tax=Phocaeicola vulgatus TaxID=821 RepID=UPI002165E237|nr:hypothetical protein [Phocaeicola vulgatus]MCS2317354.1 hypothetical protein [Phocaeicola vulgatus]
MQRYLLEILSIVDSEGTSINDYINLNFVFYTDKVYKGARAASNGLYTVTAELKKDADKKVFAKLLDNGKTAGDKKYAVHLLLQQQRKQNSNFYL